MTISNKAIEAASIAFGDSIGHRFESPTRTEGLRAALEAAEPFITAELRAEIDRRQTDRHSQSLALLALRARLARIEAEAAMLILQSPSFADVEPNDRDPEDIAAERALRDALKED